MPYIHCYVALIIMRKDVFGRELMIGDIIVCFPWDRGKNICISKISGFWGKDGFEIRVFNFKKS